MTKKKTKTETPFTDYINKKITRRQFSKYIKKAKTQEKLESLMPEPEPPEFKEDTTTTENLKVEILHNTPEGKKLSVYTTSKPIKTEY
ncbi:MAG: hypothetical protein QXN36_04095 [Candidatus Bathyarchaeia archaeon]